MAADCRARCIDGADLGSPVPGTDHMIASADPQCPVHGDPEAVMAYIAALEKVARIARHQVSTIADERDPADDMLYAALCELEELD